jgi:hypothetical protein
MWIDRSISGRLEHLAATRPVVLLTGARQTGKSSLLKRLFPEADYVTFDHLHEVEAAEQSPSAFLAAHRGQTVLDEIQYVPELFRELKIVVDQERKAFGRWILTGSQRYELMDTITESLAGRVSILNLETLSAEELRSFGHERLADHVWLGGYPELWAHERIDRNDYFESYLRTYLERDLKRLVDVKKISDFRRFIRIIASRVGQLLNYRDVSRDVGVSDATIRKWIHALELSGVIYLLPPFFANIGKRLTKSPKLYFADHGLACHLLGIDGKQAWAGHGQRGNLWESFVMMELIKTHGLTPGDDLFFYRDQSGSEIDFVIRSAGGLTLVEAKSTERIDRSRLGFDKVAPLLSKGGAGEITQLVAHNLASDRALSMGDYTSFNPLRCKPPLG